jgi:hypothetical protein
MRELARVSMTLELLKKTKVGVAVTAVKKVCLLPSSLYGPSLHQLFGSQALPLDALSRTLAVNLIAKWKLLLPSDTTKPATTKPTTKPTIKPVMKQATPRRIAPLPSLTPRRNNKNKPCPPPAPG